jgi:hypothetical protein
MEILVLRSDSSTITCSPPAQSFTKRHVTCFRYTATALQIDWQQEPVLLTRSRSCGSPCLVPLLSLVYYKFINLCFVSFVVSCSHVFFWYSW